jgi:putative thioredoxin
MSAAALDVTTATFEAEVMAASMEMPVIIDFWAPWCAPCRALTPVLEKLATQYAGKIKVVKINSDENPEISQAFRVRSIPHVAAIIGGQIADQFMGALPEGQVKAFFDKVSAVFAQAMPEAAAALTEAPPPAAPASPLDTLRARAGQLAQAGDLPGAIAALEEALKLDPKNTDTQLDAAEMRIMNGEYDDAAAKLEALDFPPVAGEQAERMTKINRRDALVAQIAALRTVDTLPETEALEAKVRANPDDLSARYDLAHAYIAEGGFDVALEHLLDIVRRDRKLNDDGARKAMINVFSMLAGNDQYAGLVSEYRRALATALN